MIASLFGTQFGFFFLPSSFVDSREREWMRRRAEVEKEEEEAGLICTFAQTQSTGQ